MFFCGDNRNHSVDSRFEQIGTVDVHHIIGQAVFRLYPFRSIGAIDDGGARGARDQLVPRPYVQNPAPHYGKHKAVRYRVRDARRAHPVSSRNPELDGWVGDKPRVLIMNKSDLADPELNRRWLAWYRDAGCYAMLSNLGAKGVTAQFARVCRLAAADILARRAARDRIQKSPRHGHRNPQRGQIHLYQFHRRPPRAAAQDRPGVTRGKQWVTVAGAAELELLDTPGILWPKIETERQGLLLCATGHRDRIHDTGISHSS